MTNLPNAIANKCDPLFRNMFPQIAKQYQCAKTKTFCILNRALSPSVHVDLISKMKPNPYTLATDGSNDSNLTKMNRLT